MYICMGTNKPKLLQIHNHTCCVYAHIQAGIMGDRHSIEQMKGIKGIFWGGTLHMEFENNPIASFSMLPTNNIRAVIILKKI